MNVLMQNDARLTSDDDDLLQAKIPTIARASIIVRDPGGSAGPSATLDGAADAAIYKELVMRKLRAEGMQKGSNMITDAWVSPQPSPLSDQCALPPPPSPRYFRCS